MALAATATRQYIANDFSSAIDTLQEIIRIEPTHLSSWRTLSTIHQELGDPGKALQLDIVAAHLTPRSGSNWRSLGATSKDLGLLNQAIYCYSQAIRADRDDVDAIWERASLYSETNKHKLAATGYTTILAHHPHDVTVLRALVPVLIHLNEINRACALLRDAFAHHRRESPMGPARGRDHQIAPGAFDLDDLVNLVELLKSLKRYAETKKTIKTGQRWLQGRESTGQAWDLLKEEDDREYDLERKTRIGWEANEQTKWLEETPVYPLDLRLRISLGVCRLMSNNKEEAKVRGLTLFAGLRWSDYMAASL